MNANNAPREAITEAEFRAISMSEKYDLRDVYENEISAKVKEVYELCQKHGIPALFSFALQNDGRAVGVMTSAHFNGPERTPTQLAAARRVICELDSNGAEAVMHQIDFIAQMEAVGQIRN